MTQLYYSYYKYHRTLVLARWSLQMSSGDVSGCGNAGPPKKTDFLEIMSSGRVVQVLYWFCVEFPPTLGSVLNRICKLPMVLIWCSDADSWSGGILPDQESASEDHIKVNGIQLILFSSSPKHPGKVFGIEYRVWWDSPARPSFDFSENFGVPAFPTLPMFTQPVIINHQCRRALLPCF